MTPKTLVDEPHRSRLGTFLAGEPDHGELCRRILVDAAEELPCDAVGLRWLDPGAGFEDALLVKTAAFARPPAAAEEDVCGEAWLRFAGQSLPDALEIPPQWEFTRHLSGPLSLGRTAWATLHLHRRREAGDWSPEKLAEFREYCLSLALAVENRLMQTMLKREVVALRGLAEAANLWQERLEAPAILESALDQALKITGFPMGLALLNDAAETALRPAASKGLDAARIARLRERPLTPEKNAGVVRAMLQQSLSISDLSSHKELAACFPGSLKALLSLALVDEDRFEGALLLADTRPIGYVAAHLAQNVGPVLASQAARVLRSVGLFSSLSARTQELERATEELGKAERRATLVKVAAAVAHQIRNPLSVVSAHVELMRDQAGDDPARTETLDLLARKVDEVNTTVQQLLELSRPLKLNPRPTRLAPLLESFAQFIRPKCRMQEVELNCFAEDGLPEVWAEDTPLQRCLLDLCLNALQMAARPGRLDIMAQKCGAWVRLSVSDDGPGIPGGILPVLFEPFASGRSGGTGMGLYNVRRICQELGAVILAGNLEGTGSRFCIHLRTGAAAPSAMEGAVAP